MAGWPPKKNATFTWFFFIRDADGDPVAGAAGLDVQFSIDGGVFVAVAGAEVDEGEGLYSCPITAAEMNGDIISLICKTSTGGAKTAAQVVYTGVRQIDDLAFPSVSGRNFVVEADGMIHADLKEWLAAAPSALVSGRVDSEVPTAGFAQGAADKVWSTVTRNLSALGFALGSSDFEVGFLTASLIAPDAITSTKIAAGAIGVSEAPNLDAAISSRAVAGDTMALTAAAINLIWDELTTEARVASSYGQLLKDQIDAAISSRAAPGALMGLVANAITAAKIATDAITAAKIAAGAIGASEAPNLDAAISSRATPAQVNTEVSDVIKTDTIAELPQAAPDATPTLEKAIMLLYMALRNKLDVTASVKEIHNDAGTVIAKKALSDDGTTYSEAEAASGP